MGGPFPDGGSGGAFDGCGKDILLVAVVLIGLVLLIC